MLRATLMGDRGPVERETVRKQENQCCIGAEAAGDESLAVNHGENSIEAFHQSKVASEAVVKNRT